MRPLLCWARVEAVGDSGGGMREVMGDAVSPQLLVAATHTRPSPWETGVTHWIPMLRPRWCTGSCSWGGISSGGRPPSHFTPTASKPAALEASPSHLVILPMGIT